MTTSDPKKSKTPSKAKFHTPPNVLREKCGYGGLDAVRINQAEKFIDTNELDFIPYATAMMDKLNVIIADVKSGKLKGEEASDRLTRPIMELKANGGMFRYMLVTEIAGIVLNFLENVGKVDGDVFEIIDAHQNTLSVILTNRLQGGGGAEGKALADELYKACNRYYKKHKIKPKG